MAPWRQPPQRGLPAAASLTLTALFVARPYLLVLGHLTNKPTSRKVMDFSYEGTPREGASAEHRGLRIEEQMWIEDRQSKTENPSFVDPQSAILDPRSSSNPRSSILHPRCSED